MHIIMSNEQQQQLQNANKMQHSQRKQQNQQQQQQESTDDDDEEESCTIASTASTNHKNNNNNTNTDERRNLEFAQKLGYDDELIHTALTRLGAEAQQNELLAELIKLSAYAPKANATASATYSARSIPLEGGNVGSGTNGQLRHIVIDGSNVALSHGNNEIFSCRGIRICVDWFRQRGHTEITAFVPNWRKESASRNNGNNNITEQELLYELERERVLVFTPSRLLDGKRVACYDDRYILKLAAETDGIVVSNDNYRDLLLESAEFRKVVQERLLMYSFVNDRFMPPDDPFGRAGPTLDVFLRLPSQKTNESLQLCPYGKKCTYGVKCKFRHQTAHTLLHRMPLTTSHSAPLNFNGSINSSLGNNNNKLTQPTSTREPLSRTKSNTIEQACPSVCNQLANSNFNMSVPTQNNGNWPSSISTEDQLSGAFNYQLEIQGNDEINRHKKLQRQVPPVQLNGINSNGFDSHHRLLVPTISAPPQSLTPHSTSNSNSNNKNHNRHQQLTRIISAPVADLMRDVGPDLRGLPMMPMYHNASYLSASDSRINAELHSSQTREEKRRLLRYHLCNLFPHHQVNAVLQRYPDETDAKTICAAIINLFPHD